MADPRIKTIRIKTGVVNRLFKERSMYEDQVEEQKKRVQKYKDDGKDEYEVRKQEEVLAESRMMVPDAHKRLQTAFDEFSSILEGAKELSETQEYQNALATLEKVKSVVQTSEK